MLNKHFDDNDNDDDGNDDGDDDDHDDYDDIPRNNAHHHIVRVSTLGASFWLLKRLSGVHLNA